MTGATVTIYTLPNCAPCRQTKRFLTARNIPFIEVSIPTDEEAAETVRKLGHRAAPVITVTDKEGAITNHWSGFRPDRLAGLG